MVENDPDLLVTFHDVTILQTTAPALLCRIDQKQVWLPRRHVAGKLWRAGDRGTLFVRYWVARERNLLGSLGAAARYALELPGQLHVVRAGEQTLKH